MSNQAVIPDFVDGDVKSMSTSLRSMKQLLETISGQRQGDSKGVPTVFVQPLSPVRNAANFYKTGDLWVDTAAKKLHYFDGGFWQQL